MQEVTEFIKNEMSKLQETERERDSQLYQSAENFLAYKIFAIQISRWIYVRR